MLSVIRLLPLISNSVPTCPNPDFSISLLRFTTRIMASSNKLHVKCRYPNDFVYRAKKDDQGEKIPRQEVPDELVPWKKPFPKYDPINFNAPILKSASWADPDLKDKDFKPKWNGIDGQVNRKSYEGSYLVSKDGEPLNIRGRTGLKGRGMLGRWGPNHAADPIVTRWKKNEDGTMVENKQTRKKILEFVAIQRIDTDEWAIPGGMVDPGEKVSETVKREFMEEALNSKSVSSQKEARALAEKVSEFFDNQGEKVYTGYVDDPRNTDNAWMETTAFLFHDNNKYVSQFKFQAGDDAKNLQWMDLGREIKLYASHKDFLQKVAAMKHAHW